ncbi:MAG: cytochrome c family protein, partial [Verrucomicrobiota bacterium]
LDRHLPELKEQSDIIVALTFADESAMNLLAKSYFELDLILGGDVGQPAQELTQANESLIGFTTNEGRTVASFSATISAGTAPHLAAPVYDVQLLWDNIPQHPELRQMVVDYRKQIRETELDVDRPAADDPNAIPGVGSTATYVGSAACQSCHQEDHAIWEKTGHAKAFKTLVRLGADADPHCIKCHTVGFGEPSGYRREYGAEKLVDVTCESCHGPASEHVDEMTSGKPKRFKFRPLGAADCTKCHYGEFSRPFVWDEFWPKVKHGGK